MSSIDLSALPGSASCVPGPREAAHAAIARRAAAEGMVLLENDGTLPLRKGSPIALYGFGARHTIKGGTGSGAVNNRYNVSLCEGLERAGYEIVNRAWLDDYDRRYVEAYDSWKKMIYELASVKPGDFMTLYMAHARNPIVPPEGAPVDPADAERAETAFFVVSRVSGEGADRYAVKGDYYLSDSETEQLRILCGLFRKVVVVLNTGGVMDLGFMDELPVAALVLISQGGMEGGNAFADVISGDVPFQGHLTDTWARRYEDYPASAAFSHNGGNLIEEKYTEGIYVGYRYFDSFGVPVRYPFGYGLTCTEFDVKTGEVSVREGCVSISVTVTNSGARSGRQVVQLYGACPGGLRKKERKRLIAFRKTGLLSPGDSEIFTLTADLNQLASYHTGRSAWFLDRGNYYLLLGTDAGNTEVCGVLTLGETVFSEKYANICPLLDALAELQPTDGACEAWERAMETEAVGLPRLPMDGQVRFPVTGWEEPAPDPRALEILKMLSREEKAALCCGRPGEGSAAFIGSAAVTVPGAAGETTPILRDRGVRNLILADGPAGLRLTKHVEINPETGQVYRMTAYEGLENRIFGTEFPHEGAISRWQFASAVPIGLLLAQTFDEDLLTEVGALIGREMKEFGVDLWLAPGMNIHRDPLCGRNYEYYSEDPLVSGRMAAAITRGVQSVPGKGTTIKHYACNNQEDNRFGVSAVVSERALREIYLKGFEIAVREAQPAAIMTSYNRVNAVHTANSRDLCTVAARREWGFGGIFMTDWTTTNRGGGSSAAKCVAAGNDLTMPGRMSDIREILAALEGCDDQYLREEDLDRCALRVIGIVLRLSAAGEARDTAM